MKIVVAGSSNTDMIIKADRIPRPGETILGGEFTIAAGGKGANQAVAAARAGGDVTFIACLGNDIFGKQALDNFRREKINVDYIKLVDYVSSGVALIFVDEKGENSIGVASGANSKLCPQDIDNAESAFKNAAALVVQLETPLETVKHAVMLAHKYKVPTILNPAPAQSLGNDILEHVTIITPNETETELLTGIRVDSEDAARKAAHVLLSKGIETVLMTMGKEGSYLITEDTLRKVPSFKVKAVDTTAAGDVYNGTLAVALSKGMDLYDAAVYASAAAALSVTKLGAQPSAPYEEEIKNFMDEI